MSADALSATMRGMEHRLPSREVRTFTGTAEVRVKVPVLGPADAIPVTGHAAIFDQRTVIGPPEWGFVEEIASGAFDEVLEDDARYLLNHDPNKVMARVASKTLRLSTDKVGLVADADLAPVTYARDLAVLMDRQDVTQMSFAFRVGAGGDTWRTMEKDEAEALGMPEGAEIRTVVKVSRLYDVSAVTYPAYEGADVALRAAEEILGPRAKVGRSADPRHAILVAEQNVRLTTITERFRMDAALAGKAH